MKRLVVATVVALVLVSLVAAGCAEKEPAGPTPEEEVVSSCITCHSDKDLLKEVASPEPAGEKSEATSGEG